MKKKYIYIYIYNYIYKTPKNVQSDPNCTALQQILVTFVSKSEFKVNIFVWWSPDD